MAKKVTAPETTPTTENKFQITEFSKIRKGEYKFAYLIAGQSGRNPGESPYILYNETKCSLCGNKMAQAAIRVSTSVANLAAHGIKTTKDGGNLYVLSCNPHNTNFDKPVCKECSQTLPPVEAPVAKTSPETEKKTDAKKPGAAKSEMILAPSQTLAWGITQCSDNALMAIYHTLTAKTITKVTNRKKAEETLVKIMEEQGMDYAKLHKICQDLKTGDLMQLPQYHNPRERQKDRIAHDKAVTEEKKGKAKKEEPVLKVGDKASVGDGEVKVVTADVTADGKTPETPKKTAGRGKKAQEAPTPVPVAPKAAPEAPVANQEPKVEVSDDELLWKAMTTIRATIDASVEKTTSSDELAKGLRIKTKQAIRLATRLAQNGFVEMQDDSDANGQFFYIALTKKGKTVKQGDLEGIKLAGAPGRPNSFAGHQIYKKISENPRRPGTFGFESWNKVVDGMTVEAYLVAGGRMQDLKWDLDRGWVELRKGEESISVAAKQTQSVGQKAFAGHKIYKLVKENPRSESARGHQSWEAIKNGMTYEAYLEAGGRYQDLKWDWERGWAEIRDDKGVPVKPQVMKGKASHEPQAPEVEPEPVAVETPEPAAKSKGKVKSKK